MSSLSTARAEQRAIALLALFVLSLKWRFNLVAASNIQSGSMWPFQKKELRPDRLPIEGPWSVAEGQNNGQTMFVRSNTGYREFGSVPGYEYQVGIAVPLKEAEKSGLPSPAEDALLGEVEDVICSSLEEQAESLLVAVITTSGMREFVFYTRQPESVRRRFEQLRNRITSHEVQLMIQLDTPWRVYAQLG